MDDIACECLLQFNANDTVKFTTNDSSEIALLNNDNLSTEIRIKAAFFDLDGTLFDTMRSWKKASCETVKYFGCETIDQADVVDITSGRTFRDCLPEFEAKYPTVHFPRVEKTKDNNDQEISTEELSMADKCHSNPKDEHKTEKVKYDFKLIFDRLQYEYLKALNILEEGTQVQKGDNNEFLSVSNINSEDYYLTQVMPIIEEKETDDNNDHKETILKNNNGNTQREIYKHYLAFLSNEKFDNMLIKESCEHLIKLKKAGLPIAIVSGSSTDTITNFVKRANLTRYVDIIIGCDQYRKGKPDPTPYLMALDILNKSRKIKIMPNEVVIYEDSANGLKSGLAANMICVGIKNEAASTESLRQSSNFLVPSLANIIVLKQN